VRIGTVNLTAESFKPKDLVTLEQVAISNMWETSALVEVLEREGILTRQEVLDMMQELRRQHLRTTT